ncbi:hypothetical protein Zmor_009322 [Zophobas morio]|uniref:CHK kinase-like domain-containing protein n=1 Tax=Zophobas morio TaxID=2755281 RepID=A0AA38ILI9_9CUCU|nr:hypothetical protein Zmor_009322 [Zophobas morio]
MDGQIKKIDTLITLPGKKIQRCEVKRLTAPGENYGSLMLSLEITTEDSEKISLVAKAVPPNEFIQEYFMTSVTFRNEIVFYKHIVPTLQEFQRQNGVTEVIDFTPKYFGSRLNLTGSDKVDQDAVLVLENLKIQNYGTLDSTMGLDLDATKLILGDLAHLHAVPLAYKLHKPLDFATNIKPFLNDWTPNIHSNMKELISRFIDQFEQLKTLKTRLVEGFDKIKEYFPAREPFGTITHNDCWVNNNMVQLQGGTPVRNKLVDYQIASYGSPARDIVFFLFSSVKNDVVTQYYDRLIEWYHGIFVSELEALKCDTKPFSLEALKKEIDIEARDSQFGHVAFMLYPIFAVRKNIGDLSDLSPGNIFLDEVTDLHKEKFLFVVEEFVKRNWV